MAVPVKYSHGGQPIGLTRLWNIREDGALDAYCMVLPTQRAQNVAGLARTGQARGLSVGVRPIRDSWDLCRQPSGNPEKIGWTYSATMR